MPRFWSSPTIHNYVRQQRWHRFWSILRVLSRRGELERLVVWAKRKRLAGPRRAYQNSLTLEELMLADYTLKDPQLMIATRIVYRLWQFFWPPPRYYAKGAAARYQGRKNELGS